MHCTAVRAGLDVLKPTQVLAPSGLTIEGPVTDVHREGNTFKVWAKVANDDRWYLLPDEVDTEPLA